MKITFAVAIMLGLAGGVHAGTAADQLGGVAGIEIKDSPALPAPLQAPEMPALKAGEMIAKYTSAAYGSATTTSQQDAALATEGMKKCVAVLEKAGIPVLEARLMGTRHFEVSYLAKPYEFSIEKYTGAKYGDDTTTDAQDAALATEGMKKCVAVLEKAGIPVLEARLMGKRSFEVSYLAKPREFSVVTYTSGIYGDDSTTLQQDTALTTEAMRSYLAKLENAQIPVLEARLANSRSFTITYLGPPSYLAHPHQAK